MTVLDILNLVIILEMTLIVIIILLTYAIKLFFYCRDKHEEKIFNQIKAFFLEKIDKKSELKAEEFKKSWKNQKSILSLFKEVDESHPESFWLKLKEQVAFLILLPLARTNYRSFFWEKRLFSTESFGLAFENEDEIRICRLVQDKNTLVHLDSIIAAIKFHSPITINLVIDCIAERRRLGQTIYLKFFVNAAPQIREIVAERLQIEISPFTRATCYKILSFFPLENFSCKINTAQDIESENLELKLSALRFVAAHQGSEAIPLLLSLLQSPSWEVRATSALLLGRSGDSSVIPHLAKALRDSAWWVRVNAANALKNLGPQGIAVLKMLDPKEDLYAYQISKNVISKSFLDEEST